MTESCLMFKAVNPLCQMKPLAQLQKSGHKLYKYLETALFNSQILLKDLCCEMFGMVRVSLSAVRVVQYQHQCRHQRMSSEHIMWHPCIYTPISQRITTHCFHLHIILKTLYMYMHPDFCNFAKPFILHPVPNYTLGYILKTRFCLNMYGLRYHW